MPVFEYECEVCGMRFDLHRHFGDPDPTTCPLGHESVHRVFAPPAIIFKGSGFYATDHGRNGRAGQRGTRNKEPRSEKQATQAEAKAGEKP